MTKVHDVSLVYVYMFKTILDRYCLARFDWKTRLDILGWMIHGALGNHSIIFQILKISPEFTIDFVEIFIVLLILKSDNAKQVFLNC